MVAAIGTTRMPSKLFFLVSWFHCVPLHVNDADVSVDELIAAVDVGGKGIGNSGTLDNIVAILVLG